MREVFADRSARVELAARDEHGQKFPFLVREIRGRVHGRGRQNTSVRLWTSLLDAKKYPAAELLALYAQRWEVEITVKELKYGNRINGGKLHPPQHERATSD